MKKLMVITMIVLMVLGSTFITSQADEGIESSNPTVQAIYDAFNEHNADLLADAATPDFKVWLNTVLVQEGSEGLATWVLGNYTFLPDGAFIILHEVVEGDLNITHFSFSGTNSIQVEGSPPPTGNEIHFAGTLMARMEGDKVAEMWVYWDTYPVFTELGLIPDPNAVGIESEFLFDLQIDIEWLDEPLEGPSGSRGLVMITGGTVTGPNINGEVLSFGEDASLTREDGATELNVQIAIRTDDGHLIYVPYKGIIFTPPESENVYWRVFMNFETGAEEYSWLNTTMAVGIGSFVDTVEYKVYAIK
jgi:predicted ester cyclase